MSDVGAIGGGSSGSITGQLDVQWIVEQLIYAKQQPIRDLEVYEYFYEAKKEAFQELNTKVSAVESAMYNVVSGGFSDRSATLSTDDYFSATASSTAANGEYYVVAKQLATAHSVASGASDVTDANSHVFSNGTLTFRDNNNNVIGTVDYSGTTQSLNGIRDEINNLGEDITATVINYGTSSSPKYRLQVTADDTGTENNFTITESTTGKSLELSTTVDAKDAQIYVNVDPETNPNDYISRSSNTIDDVISGVTLNLKQANSTLSLDYATTVSIGTDTSGLKENVQAFVEAYNDAMDFLNSQFTYDEQAERAGVLSGEAGARKIKEDLLSLAVGSVGGLTADDSDYRGFSVIGLEMTKTGNLQINDEKFDDAIENHLDDVERIFKDYGSTSNSEVSYVGKSGDTKAGTYDVYITQVAEQAVASGIDTLDTLGQIETLTITYGNKDYNVTLSAGLDSTQVVSAINQEMEDEGVAVYAREVGGILEIVTDDYGTSQSVSVKSDIAHDEAAGSTGIGITKITEKGENVDGTINGNSATGNGRALTSDSGDSKGLIVYSTSTSVAVPGEAKGTVTFTEGVGEALRERMFEHSFPYTGLIAKNIESLDDKLANIADQISDINRQLEVEQEILIQQYTLANEAMSEMNYMLNQISGL